MRRSFLAGFALAVLAGVLFLAGRSCLAPRPSPSASPPPLGPSLMSPSPSPSPSLPPLGLQDRLQAEKNIAAAAALGEAAVPALAELCRKGSPLARRDALAALERISPPAACREAVEMLSGGNPILLDEALAVCARARFRPAAEQVKRLLSHDDPLVRARAALAAAFVLEKEALPLLLPLLEAPEAVVRDAAGRAVSALTYRDFGFAHSGFPADRAAAVRRIRAWLAKHGGESRFAWLEARVEECLLGLASPDPFVRLDSKAFLTSVLGEIEYNPDDPPDRRLAAVAKARKRWLSFRPLLEKRPPLLLSLEAE
ncbi:MAG: hypothetical protein DRP90_04900 [Planctomycetota bacterium]|nr:MAG: hypothetical protein DRP90_04900 [Planctomycetota bacterium]